MKVKWLGHATYLITSDTGTKIITDPYITLDNLNYGEIKESADIVTVSHDHLDHSNVAVVRGNPKVVRETAEVKGIKVRGILTYHDGVLGKQKGSNTVFRFVVDGVKVCHLGDLSHKLSDKQVAEIGEVDILLVPVGGFFTIDAMIASQVCDQLKPRVIMPMHFRNDKCTYPINGVDEFLQGKKDVSRLDTSEVEFKSGGLPTNTQIIVLKSAL